MPTMAFTPSVMPRAVLERTFVARQELLHTITDRIDEAARSDARNHTLLVGARGSGKTHLIALAYYGARDLIDSGGRLQVSWLPEDPWTIVSYGHLLGAILARLESSATPSSDGDERSLEADLVSRAREGGTVVVLVENLDQILHQIGEMGQQRLRHLLQAERSLLLVATTTRLDRNLADQARPFYGFFTTTKMQPFTVEQAQSMLRALALEDGDDALAANLTGEQALARLRAIEHLAGGQPRLWATLSTALTIDRLDSLVELLLTRFDDLTPYYQERLARLSPQQRLVTAELAAADHPLHVAELAARLGIAQRSLGKTVSELADLGWVAPVASAAAHLVDRRRTYYELAEPLVRLSFQIKESRGTPLRLVVDFIKGWFDPKDLTHDSTSEAEKYLELAIDDFQRDPVTRIVRHLTRLPESRAPAVELLGTVDDALAGLAKGRADLFLSLPSAIRRVLDHRLIAPGGGPIDSAPLRADIHRSALQEMGNVPHPDDDKWVERAADLTNSNGPIGFPLMLAWLAHSWQFDKVMAFLRTAMPVPDPDHPIPTAVWGMLADAYQATARVDDAISLWEQILPDVEHNCGAGAPETLAVRSNLAGAYSLAGQLERAIPLFVDVLGDSERILGPDHPETLQSRSNLGVAYHQAGRVDDAIRLHARTLADTERTVGPEHPSTLRCRNNLAGAYQSAGRTDEAIALFERTLADRDRILGPDHPETLQSRDNLAGGYESASRPAEALPLYESVLVDAERILGPTHPETQRYRDHLAAAYMSVDRLGDSIELDERTLDWYERVFGADCPETLITRAKLASAYQSAGRQGDAIRLYQSTLSDRERILGHDHPDSLRSRHNLACAYSVTGESPRAIALLESTLADAERVLGSDHPNTALIRKNLADARRIAHDSQAER